MVNTFLLRVPYLRRAKKDFLYRADQGSLQRIRKFLNRKKTEFQRLDWNLTPYALEKIIIEYDIAERDSDMSERLKDDSFIVLNSSGFFHHRTFYFVEALEEDVCYVQLDSHPDFWNIRKRLNGSGFVSEISRLRNVKSTHLVGVTPNEALVPEDKTEEEIRENIRDINIISSEPLEALLFPCDESEKERYEEVYRRAIKIYPQLTYKRNPTEFDPDSIPDLPVYLSVDLDVIRYFPTLWYGHGRWNSEKLCRTIWDIGTKRRIIGADICGLDNNFSRENNPTMKHFWFFYKILEYVMKNNTSQEK
ncbi:hypothetical protein GF386_06400 [Candidatus Pacearchaeota archaeon]|nr:hypothetical protein [Candidatus Pacearchaeota archaeon]MBD3283719.1 hypothetical protein [Candidatus Pacearchaeota archaeon]